MIEIISAILGFIIGVSLCFFLDIEAEK